MCASAGLFVITPREANRDAAERIVEPLVAQTRGTMKPSSHHITTNSPVSVKREGSQTR